MRFLLPAGGIVDHRFGIMTTPGHKGIPVGIKEGMDWAADNEAYTRGFDPDRFFDWLEMMRPYKETCLFIPVPDVVGNASATLNNYKKWEENFSDWPLAYVAQDGSEELEIPESCSTVFVGGTTGWKMSLSAIKVIKKSQSLSKHIHIGRVNYWKRYQHFRSFNGSKEFTCDGTRQRFEGVDRTLDAWASYMERPHQIHLPLPWGDSSS